MIETASLVIPSPNIREKSLGYSSYFIIEIAANTSEEHKRALISNTSIISKVNIVLFPSSESYFLISINCINPKEIEENKTKIIIVASNPNSIMYPMFSKNLFLLMLKPEANTIGGKQR